MEITNEEMLENEIKKKIDISKINDLLNKNYNLDISLKKIQKDYKIIKKKRKFLEKKLNNYSIHNNDFHDIFWKELLIKCLYFFFYKLFFIIY